MKVRLEHGGDWAGYMLEHGTQPLDFSANVSPLGLPDGVRRAMAQSLENAHLYPDPLCRALRAGLAVSASPGPAGASPVDASASGREMARLFFVFEHSEGCQGALPSSCGGRNHWSEAEWKGTAWGGQGRKQATASASDCCRRRFFAEGGSVSGTQQQCVRHA